MRLGKAYRDIGLVLAGPDGAFIRPDALSTNFAAFIRRHPELPKVQFHDLRHTHASLLLQAGEHAKVVSERLGHSSVAFTLDTYGHLMPGMEEGRRRSWMAYLVLLYGPRTTSSGFGVGVCKMFANGPIGVLTQRV